MTLSLFGTDTTDLRVSRDIAEARSDRHLQQLLRITAEMMNAEHAALSWRPHRGAEMCVYCSSTESSADRPFTHVLAYPLEIGTVRGWTLRVCRKTAFTKEELDVFAHCKKLFRAGFKLWRKAEQATRRATAIEALVGVLDCGALIVDPQNRIVFSNDRAKEVLSTGNGLVNAGNYLSARGAKNAIRLQSILQHALNAPLSVGDAEKSCVSTIERIGASTLSIAATKVAPEASSARALIAIYIVDPLRDLCRATEIVCRTHGLTATEVRLVQHLTTGAALGTACERMQIQTQTGRTYLRQIFIKFGICRQADLMRFVFTSALPIRIAS